MTEPFYEPARDRPRRPASTFNPKVVGSSPTRPIAQIALEDGFLRLAAAVRILGIYQGDVVVFAGLFAYKARTDRLIVIAFLIASALVAAGEHVYMRRIADTAR